jgi:hypothetical protein
MRERVCTELAQASQAPLHGATFRRVGLDQSLGRLPAGARSDLLRVLESPSNVRADLIRQLHERGLADMAELLILCEEEPERRQAVIEALRAIDAAR